MRKRELRVPSHVLAHIRFASLMFGGIGAGKYNTGVLLGDHPFCVYGLCNTLPYGGRIWTNEPVGVPRLKLASLGITVVANDSAVRSVNRRLGRPHDMRISFEQWVKAMNIVEIP